MTQRGPARATISLVTLIAVSSAALACGFEDPNSAQAARGLLNWAYPQSLHVSTAVWQAQAAGIIARDQTPAAVKALLGYQKALQRLSAFRDGLSAGLDGRAVPTLSLVMLGPVLWTRFKRNDMSIDMEPHAGGPTSGDTVIVTEEPVITAFVEGKITPREARDLGLLKVYGPDDSVAQLWDWLERWRLGGKSVAAAPIH